MKWITLKSHRPREGQLCLVFAKSADPFIPFRHISYYRRGEFVSIVPIWGRSITHWMPFPKTPK